MGKKMTFEEIVDFLKQEYDYEDSDAIEDYGCPVAAFADEGLMYIQVPEDFEPLSDAGWEGSGRRRNGYIASLPIGPCELVHSSGGIDEGSTYIRVWHFLKHNVYVKAQGWYQSHHGTEFYERWGCLSEVHPHEETVIVYK